MAAILGLDGAKVISGCAEAGSLGGAEVVEAVNFNDPAQTVIAGTKAGLRRPEGAQGCGCQACVATAGVGAVPLQPDEAGPLKKAARGSGIVVLAAPADSRGQQHRRGGRRMRR